MHCGGLNNTWDWKGGTLVKSRYCIEGICDIGIAIAAIAAVERYRFLCVWFVWSRPHVCVPAVLEDVHSQTNHGRPNPMCTCDDGTSAKTHKTQVHQSLNLCEIELVRLPLPTSRDRYWYHGLERWRTFYLYTGTTYVDPNFGSSCLQKGTNLKSQCHEVVPISTKIK